MRYLGSLLGFFTAIICNTGAAYAQARMPPAIDWYVEDRFRLFDQASPEARARMETLMTDIREAREAGRVDLLPFYERLRDTLAGESASSFRTSNYAPSSPSDFTRSGRYAPNYLYPTAYTIRVSAPGEPSSASCRWRIGALTLASPCGTQTELAVPARPDGSGASADLFLAVGSSTERLAEKVVITDHLVVAMGDSYISGEGNPDVPVAFAIDPHGDGRRFARSDWPARLTRGNRERLRHGQAVPEEREYRPAIWWDQPCHRSLLSWPVLASVAFAARDRHRAVTLVHLGCSGDEVSDGLLHLRRELPGGGREEFSQQQLLLRLLDRPGGRRRVDTALLSIGGNDIGFSYVVAALVLPPNGWRLGALAAREAGKGTTACPYERERRPLSRFCGHVEEGDGPVIDRRSAEVRLGELPRRLRALDTALDEVVSSDRVFQVTYPNAMIGEHGGICQTAVDERIRSGFESLLGRVPANRRGRRLWSFEVRYRPEAVMDGSPIDPGAECDNKVEGDDSEACQGLWVWHNLNETIRRTAETTGWGVIDSHQPVIRRHGWCNTSPSAPLRLPLARVRSDGSLDWNGWAPGDFRPYDRALSRWFRTSNDSVLTEFVDPDRFHKGTMHPTYRAHLAIAEATLREAFPD
jgi:hypothetical protein